MGKKLDTFVVHYTEWILKYRWVVIALTLGLAMAFASGLPNLGFATNYRVFFSQENPELKAFEEFQSKYTKSDNILFVIQPKDGKIFSPMAMDAMERITKEAWQIPYSIRVDSLTNFQHTWANEDDLTVEDLVQDAKNKSQAYLNQRESIALNEPLLLNNLVAPDGLTGGVNVILQMPQKTITEVPEAVAVARDIVSRMRVEYPDLTIVLSGMSMMNNAFSEAGMHDMGHLVPIMYLILIGVMVLALRSVLASMVTVVIIFLSSLMGMGIGGYLKVLLTPISMSAPTIIMTLAIADSIHILVSMQTLMQEGKTKREALIEAIRVNAQPIFITSLTTIIGFLSLNFSDSPPFWHLGNITAAGIASAWFLSMTILPCLASLLPIKARKEISNSKTQALMTHLASFVIKRKKLILWGVGGLTIVLALLAPTIELNDEFVKYFDKRLEFRNDVDFANDNLTGVYNMEFSIPAEGPGGINELEYLNHLERFSQWLKKQSIVTHVYSYSDIIKRLNKNMNADNPKFYAMPDQRELAAQYLLLYELSLPYGLDLNDRITIDKSATRVSVAMQNTSTENFRAFKVTAENWLKDNTPSYMLTEATSSTTMFAFISHRNVVSMLKGNVLALLLIAIVMMISLKDIKMGALSIVPNALPILCTFGIWSIFVGQVGMAAATVTATSMGIIVDDTVHFLSKYVRSMREDGATREEAIRHTFKTVGPAILATTTVLVIGFSYLATSVFMINSQMGLLTAIAIIVAFFFDVLLLPAILLIGDSKK